MMSAIKDASVPTDEWIEAHMIRSQAWVSIKRPEEAISILEDLIHVIPPLPIPGLCYLQKLENKRISAEEEVDHSNGAITIGYEHNSGSPKELKVQDFIAGIFIVYLI